MIAANVKSCEVIVLDPVALTYISRSIDSVNIFYVEVWFSLYFVVVASVKPGII